MVGGWGGDISIFFASLIFLVLQKRKKTINPDFPKNFHELKKITNKYKYSREMWNGR